MQTSVRHALEFPVKRTRDPYWSPQTGQGLDLHLLCKSSVPKHKAEKPLLSISQQHWWLAVDNRQTCTGLARRAASPISWHPVDLRSPIIHRELGSPDSQSLIGVIKSRCRCWTRCKRSCSDLTSDDHVCKDRETDQGDGKRVPPLLI